MCTSEVPCKMACFKRVSTIFIIGMSSEAFFVSWGSIDKSFSSYSPQSFLISFLSSLIISLNSISNVFWYWDRAFLMLSGVVSLGRIFTKGMVFSINSMVLKSSGSIMATSRLFSFLLKATILWALAIDWGIILKISGGITSFSKLIKGIPNR